MSNSARISGKPTPRFKGEYFKYDLQKQTITPKFKYSIQSDFQRMFVKQFKRGIYKIFLEERSESVGDALDSRFDFIREFARYGIGDYPVFYCQPKIPAVMVSEDFHNPVIRFTEHSENVMQCFGFYSYTFINHTLAFPVMRAFEITIDGYLKYLWEEFGGTHSKIVEIREITDLDFTYSFAFAKNIP